MAAGAWRLRSSIRLQACSSSCTSSSQESLLPSYELSWELQKKLLEATNEVVIEFRKNGLELQADKVTKACIRSDRSECQLVLKPRAEILASLLRLAARHPHLYERPARHILLDAEHALKKALHVAQRCSHQSSPFLSRLFPVPSAKFKKLSFLLDKSLCDLSWLLRVSHPSAADDDSAYLGLPHVALNMPILGLIWEQVARLQYGPPDHRPEAAAALSSLAGSDSCRKLIVEEGGAAALLRLLKEGRPEAQENAIRAIGLLATDPESVEEMVVKLGACSVLASVLKDGTMTVRASVAKVVAEFATHFPKSQDVFLQHNTERLLVDHLAFETLEEHSKHSVLPKASMHSVDQSTMSASRTSSSSSSSSTNPTTTNPFFFHSSHHHHHLLPQQVAGGAVKGVGGDLMGREMEEPGTKAQMKAVAAAALGRLCRGNPAICRNVTEPRAMLCFAVLLEKGTSEVRSSSALALMEIAKVAEKDSDLRDSAFNLMSPAARAVVDQLLRVVERREYDDFLVIPCIITLGCLAKTFGASDTRIIPPLVRLLEQREVEVMKEAALALTKFASEENYLSGPHSRAIIEAGGARHLVLLVYFEEQEVKVPALVLLCWIAKAVPDSEVLAECNVLNVLEWASRQSKLMQDEAVDGLLPATRGSLELFQSRV